MTGTEEAIGIGVTTGMTEGADTEIITITAGYTGLERIHGILTVEALTVGATNAFVRIWSG
ncbi:hypothetical protein GCM10007094_37550 [Pseudovibrio japonicus]|uniref:Uncharacterized protein n=1 Tax=Pseudovibrio japonicus TaxID=366534 RepID=A0ABQ3ETR0_9HYPH|nr:hypothetical protein GCM10007094_37550 [Pseudovibrio japonicus]